MNLNISLFNISREFIFVIILLSVLLIGCNNDESVVVRSPNGANTIEINTTSKSNKNTLTFSISRDNKIVISPSEIEIISKEIDFSTPFTIINAEERTVENEWTTKFGERNLIPDNYNQLIVYLESTSAKLNLICRAYNEGIAFAYEIPQQNNLKEISIDDEEISYNFLKDYNVWSTPKRGKNVHTAQGKYRKIPLSQLEEGCERPLVVEIANDLTIALAEAAMVDYARLSFDAAPDTEFGILSTLDKKVTKSLPFQSPWRVVMMAENHGKLLETNYIIQNLNDPSEIEDESWITPGKVLRETTLTTKGGIAAVEFVASHNMQYVHFDAGWYGKETSNKSDATTITLDPKRSNGPFDLEAVCKYAKEKNVKVMVYVNRRALEKQLDELLPLYKKWGIAGIKFGFVRVGSQDATKWMHDAIKKCAEYEMVVDVHDEYRPTGFSRTYPNFLTQEGIRGDEETVQNQHTLITMFTRMLAGAADNTVCYYSERVSEMGSHTSQLAKTVCLFSPLQFLYWYDRAPLAPIKEDGLWGKTNLIGNEPELDFFNAVPTTWDDTKVLAAKIGELGVIARRKGNDWFVGCINGEEGKSVNLDFSFLDRNSEYTAKLYTDDETINTRTRVKIEELYLNSESKLTLDVKANNGFTMQITK